LNPEASGINHVGFFSPMAKAGFEMKPDTSLKNEAVENDLAVSK
jgi:ribosomal protein S16